MTPEIAYQLKTALIVLGYFACIVAVVAVVIVSALYNSMPKDLDASGYEDDREGEQS
jgi:hypothetical protein